MTLSDLDARANRPSKSRSVLAVLAGFGVTTVLSVGTDMALMTAGLFPDFLEPGSFTTPMWLTATAYRSLFGAAGSAVAAQLAPQNPMRHALALGVVGFLVSVLGAVTMWDVGPNWYPLALVVLALPSAWVGGRVQHAWAHRRKAD